MSIYLQSYKIRKFLRRAWCYLKGVQRYFDCGWWVPHDYKEIKPMTSDVYYADVYASSRGFRLALNDDKRDNEILLKNVAIRRYICKNCGKEWIVADNNKENYFKYL